MSNLRNLKLRIAGVKSTQKITRAMRMVAAAKLMKARKKIDASIPYISAIEKLVNKVTFSLTKSETKHPLLVGDKTNKTHLLILITSDRGLCGSFNMNLSKELIKKINELKIQNKDFKIFCIGKKGYEILKNKFNDHIIENINFSTQKNITIEFAEKITDKLISLFNNNEFNSAYVFYNHFKSAISGQIITKQIIPILSNEHDAKQSNLYEFEPSQEFILEELIPKNLSVQLYYMLLENSASEYGARMTSMENATNNAQEMIKKLTLLYNRTRQSSITKELIEIISGAEALK